MKTKRFINSLKVLYKNQGILLLLSKSSPPEVAILIRVKNGKKNILEETQHSDYPIKVLLKQACGSRRKEISL